MHIKFNYPHKIRNDFLHDVVKHLVRQRHRLGITQDDLNEMLGMADRLVSHWECGVRSPTAFHLYCWADALQSRLAIIPNASESLDLANDNKSRIMNDNLFLLRKELNNKYHDKS